MAVIDAKKYLRKSKEIAEETARKFYTDTYYSDQNACSSPRILIWVTGDIAAEDLDVCRETFWGALQKEADERYDMKPVQAIDKLSNFTELAMKSDKPVTINKRNNKLFVIDINEADSDIFNYKTGGGFFFQYAVKNLDEIIPFLEKQCQTVAVFGIEKSEVVGLVRQSGVRGVDRVVDIGDTMGLEFVWDGYRMVENMSRVIYVYDKSK